MAGRARRHPVAPNGTLIWCPVNRAHESQSPALMYATELQALPSPG